MKTLFALAGDAAAADALLRTLPTAAAEPTVAFRRYPPADDARHLQSLVRDGRDRHATRWWRGTVLAIGAGAAIGAVVNGVLGAGFGMFGGLLDLAIPLGAGIGAFLGGFTAAMTGTERPREELRALWPQVRRGAVLVQCSSADRDLLATVAAQCDARQLTWLVVDG